MISLDSHGFSTFKRNFMSTLIDELFHELEMENYETPTRGRAITNTGQQELANLPLIVCGPILRRVHYDSVSVWLAFKEEVRDITITVFDVLNPALKITGNVQSPLKIGKNLFITLATATSNGSFKLFGGRIYAYNISFLHGSARKELKTEGVLKGGIDSISYKPYSFPTFCLPAETLNDLKITHGSCRKTHGGQTDALRALDTAIELSSSRPSERPQLLCLTGDQIYADDVADALLHKMIETAKQLLGWIELAPPKWPGRPEKYKPEEFLPGNRRPIIAPTGNKSTGKPGITNTQPIRFNDLTTSDSKSHLVFLSEYLMMYLFNYSDTFLVNTSWPTPAEVYKTNLTGPNAQSRLKEFHEEIEGAKNFARGLPFVKKALANISTLMVFDDHDITDDWFITKEWSEMALKFGSLSRFYIRNALAAYALFQDWGNDFRKYLPNISDTTGHKLLMALDNNQTYPNTKIRDLERLLPELVSDGKGGARLKSAFRWDYTIEYKSFNLVVLNTRTERVYSKSEHPYGTLTERLPIPSNTQKFLVLVSPAPVFGDVPMEESQKQAGQGTFSKAGLAGRENKFTGMFTKDQEAWSLSQTGFEQFLGKLGWFKKILILSGDVHYGFTAHVKLWNSSSGKNSFTEIVQSTSSALKNSTPYTQYPASDLKKSLKVIPVVGKIPLIKHIPVYGDFVVKTGRPYYFIKLLAKQWDKYRKDLARISNPAFKEIETYTHGTKLLIGPKFQISPIQYSIEFIKSKPHQPSSGLFQNIRRSRQAAVFTDTRTASKFQDTVVGKDNFSVISFNRNTVTNRIWYASGQFDAFDKNEANRLLFPYAEHSINLISQGAAAEEPVNIMRKQTNSRPQKETAFMGEMENY